ncbi:Fic family protein [Nitratireductor sp. XY-223]|uniref:Fic family protein n=1 Tax=Hyphomicrobiales TaxID=356 RepID=UPI0010AA6971|nr:Fic family protein [Nitratireductor sp. XY-223]
MNDVPRASTESQLREWRTGQVGGERFAAALLHISEFENIDPQAPLGGADDRKDILCDLKGKTYVAAAYFPTTDKTFNAVRKKFNDDVEGPIRHNRDGIVFITNQHIGLADRQELEELAASKGKLCILYHRERIRALLDSPAGYGVRLEFLRLPMTEAEQLAYFDSSRNKLEYALERHSREIRNLARKIDTLQVGQNFAVETVARIAHSLGEDVDVLPVAAQPEQDRVVGEQGDWSPFSAALSVGILLAVHRLSCPDLPPRMLGKPRTQTVWIGNPGGDKAAEYQPPDWAQIPGLVGKLLAAWNENYAALAVSSDAEKLKAIADFHHELLSIHPFLDGNGRMARAIMIQQCIDLFGHVEPDLIDRGADYYKAVKQAGEGDLAGLIAILRAAITT